MTAIAVGLVVLATAAPAAAHDQTVAVPGGYGQVLRQHTTVRACDTAADGVTIRADFQTSTGASGRVAGIDGVTPGCGQVTLITGTVTLWRVCADAFCTPWTRS